MCNIGDCMNQAARDAAVLNKEDLMLAFFMHHHKTELEMAELKILHGYHDLIDGAKKLYDEKTKGMTAEQIKEWEDDEDDITWGESFGILTDDIVKPTGYRLDIEVDECSVLMTYHTKYFWLRYNGYLTCEKPKLSEMKFDVELDDDAHFLIELVSYGSKRGKGLKHSHDGSQVQASSIMRMQEGDIRDRMDDECLDLLIDVVNQACSHRDCPHDEEYLDTMALSAYADAIRYLAKRGKVTIITDHGRRVIAKLKNLSTEKAVDKNDTKTG